LAVPDGLGDIMLRVFGAHGYCSFETIRRAPPKIYEDSKTSSLLEGLPAIFQRYHQEYIPESTNDWTAACTLRDKIEAAINSHKENGTGIGLSLSYHIVAALGGDLKYDSNPEQGLTKFWFSLPHNQALSNHTIELPPQESPKRRRIVEDDENMSVFTFTKQEVAANGVKAMDPPSVLVVEDTPMCAKLICRTLNKLNIPTRWAVNGQEAIDILKSEGMGVFHLIIMDLRMPVMDGFQATKIIKQEMKLTIPVVALTGETGPDVEVQCMKTGFDEFKQKPMKMNELIKIIQQHTGYVSSKT
jgi:CheY-like chemotaxis protein